jgi:hypothetical protein
LLPAEAKQGSPLLKVFESLLLATAEQYRRTDAMFSVTMNAA